MAGPFYVDGAVGNDGNAGTSEGAGNAWATMQKAADTAAAGEIVYIKSSAEYALSAACDFDTNSGSLASGSIKFIGYDSVITDGGRPRFTGDSITSAFNVTQDYLEFHNFRISVTSSNGIYFNSGATYHLVNNCLIDGGGTNGMYLYGDYVMVKNCEVSGSYTYSIYTWTNCQVNNCVLHGASTAGLYSATRAHNNIIYDCTTGIHATNWRNATIIGNVIDDCTTGVRFDVDFASSAFYNNIISNNTTGVLQDAGEYQVGGITDYNAWYENDADTNNWTKGANAVNLSADPYTNQAGRDYTLNSTAGGGAACKNTGYGPVGLL